MKEQKWNKDKVWNNLEKQLNNERRRRILWFWSIGLLLIAFVSLWGYFLLNSTDYNQKVIKGDKLNATLEISSDSLRNPTITKTENEITQQRPVSSSDKIIHTNIKRNEPNKLLKDKSIVGDNSVLRLTKDKVIIVKNGDNQMNYEDLHHSEKNETSISHIERLPLLSPDLFKLKSQLHGANIKRLSPLGSNTIYSWTINIQFQGSKPNWQGDRPKNEQILMSSTQDILLSKNLRSHISVFGGISHERIWITYDHTSVHESQTEIHSDSGLVYDIGNGLSYYESGRLTQTTTVRRRILNNNSVSRVSIPVGIGYHYRFKRFDLYSNLGLRIRLFQVFDGVITDEGDDHLEDVQEIRKHRFKGGTDIGLDTQLGVAYQFDSNWSLGIHYKFRLDDVFQLHNDEVFDDLIFQGGGLQLKYNIGLKNQ